MARVLGTTEALSGRFMVSAVVLLIIIWTARLFWGFGMPISMALGYSTSNSAKAPDAPEAGMKPDRTNPIPGPEVHLEGIADRVAMILDTKYTTHLVPLIMHFSAVLGPDWPIVFFTSRETRDAHFDPDRNATLSAAWLRSVNDKMIQVVTIPDSTQLGSREGVNRFFASPWLYVQLAPARHMLMFQADSILCANSERSVDDFLKYDIIGAPWGLDEELWYNGGLSLRNRDMMMVILRERDYDEDMQANKGRNWSTGEDVWFGQNMRKMNGSMPTRDDACHFSVLWDYTWVDAPLGYHKAQKEIPQRLDEIRQWCPEIDLATPNYLEGEEKKPQA